MKKYVLNRNITVQKFNNKFIIIDGNGPIMHTLNPIASFIFEAITDGQDEEEIAKSITEKYDIDLKTAKKDIEVLITSLIEQKLLKKKSPKK